MKPTPKNRRKMNEKKRRKEKLTNLWPLEWSLKNRNNFWISLDNKMTHESPLQWNKETPTHTHPKKERTKMNEKKNKKRNTDQSLAIGVRPEEQKQFLDQLGQQRWADNRWLFCGLLQLGIELTHYHLTLCKTKWVSVSVWPQLSYKI